MMNGHGKSDNPIVPEKLPNKAERAAEAMEGRGLAKGNRSEQTALRTLGRSGAQSALGRIRQAAQKDGKQQFTALYHHVYNVDMLRESYYALKRKAAEGVDRNRVPMLLAVLARRGGLQLGGQDVFVNAAGGVQVAEPAADLAIALAIASSFTDKPLAPRSVFVGEIGLGGEIRSVTQLEARIAEAARIGFKRAFVPAESAGAIAGRKALDIVPVSNIIEALDGCTKGS